jgi:1,2-phenylacetyl-CoA epoxidase PaaB subunit
MRIFKVYMIQLDGETLGYLGTIYADDNAEALQVARRTWGRYRFFIE